MVVRRLRPVLAVLVLTATAAAAFAADPAFELRGHVVDSSGAMIVGASVTLREVAQGAERHTTTDAGGEFVFGTVPPGRYTIVALAPGFAPSARDVDPAATPRLKLTLDPAPLSEQITVSSALRDAAVVSTATKLAASPMDIPQTIDAVPQTLLRAQAALSMQDALRNVAGVTPNLGEGRRDQFLIRGFSAQSDTLVDGVRDDALYYRDLSTVERVEVLKGPASALFGRGSSGGVINRVSKRPRLDKPVADAAILVGGFGTKRVSFDAGRPKTGGRLAYRVAGAWEDSGSFRDFGALSRVTAAPSITSFLSPTTSFTAQAEFLHDRRVPDRGIPSVDGRPAPVRISQYYGSPQDDFICTDVMGATVTVEHQLGSGWLIRNVMRDARYDTTWSNTQSTDVRATAGGLVVKRSQYNADQLQHNLFNQAELVGGGRFAGTSHVLLAGVEAGTQRRDVTRFNGTAPDVTLIDPVLTAPTYSTVAATDNRFAGNVVGVYVQDLVAFAARFKALVGVRADRYDQRLDDRTARNIDLSRVDAAISPRAGLVYQPTPHLSLYSSVSRSFQPSGEGLSLAVNSAELKPEVTRNVEGGAKFSWAGGRVTTTASVFRLDRTNIKTTDPVDPTRLVLVGRQRSDGFELALDGTLTTRWFMHASFASLDAVILRSNSVLNGIPIEGNRPGLTPKQSGGIWTTVDVAPKLTLGGGITATADRFTSNDDLVTLPTSTRVDAVAVYRLGRYAVSLNIQNLGDARYYESAGGNFQIYPGAPRHALLTVRYSF